MNKGRLLWMLVLADLLISFASVGSEAFFGWTLPPGLTNYQSGPNSPAWLSTASQVFQFVLLLVTCLSAFAAWIGLVVYWRYARGLYVLACALWLLYVLFDGPSVLPAPALMFRMLNGVVSGLILGLVYFTDLARRFEPAPARAETPAVVALVR